MKLSETLFIVIVLSALGVISSGCSTSGSGRKTIYSSMASRFPSSSTSENGADVDAPVKPAQDELLQRANDEFDKDKESWLRKALEDYKTYLISYPQDKAAPLALFRIGQIQFKFRNCNTCDVVPIYSAINSFKRVITEYPGSAYEAEARTQIRACREILAETSNRIGMAAFIKEAYKSALIRFKEALELARDGVNADPSGTNGAESEQGAEALFNMGKSLEAMENFNDAKETYITLNNEFPGNIHRAEVEKILRQLNTDHPAGK